MPSGGIFSRQHRLYALKVFTSHLSPSPVLPRPSTHVERTPQTQTFATSDFPHVLEKDALGLEGDNDSSGDGLGGGANGGSGRAGACDETDPPLDYGSGTGARGQGVTSTVAQPVVRGW